MSRDYRDQRGGHKSRYMIDSDNHAEFARFGRKSARLRARRALRDGDEPEPRYPQERLYYD